MSEQWKTKGLCKLCRRRTYCRKHCRASKARIRDAVNEFIEKATGIAKLRQEMAKPEAQRILSKEKGSQ